MSRQVIRGFRFNLHSIDSLVSKSLENFITEHPGNHARDNERKKGKNHLKLPGNVKLKFWPTGGISLIGFRSGTITSNLFRKREPASRNLDDHVKKRLMPFFFSFNASRSGKAFSTARSPRAAISITFTLSNIPTSTTSGRMITSGFSNSNRFSDNT